MPSFIHSFIQSDVTYRIQLYIYMRVDGGALMEGERKGYVVGRGGHLTLIGRRGNPHGAAREPSALSPHYHFNVGLA